MAAAAPACSFGSHTNAGHRWRLCSSVVFAHSHQSGGQLAQQKAAVLSGNPSARHSDRLPLRPPAVPWLRGSVATQTHKSLAKAQSCRLPRSAEHPARAHAAHEPAEYRHVLGGGRTETRGKSPILGHHKSSKHHEGHPRRQSFPGTLQKGTNSLANEQQAHSDPAVLGLPPVQGSGERSRAG